MLRKNNNPDLIYSIQPVNEVDLFYWPWARKGHQKLKLKKHGHEVEPDKICHCAIYTRPTRRTCLYRQISMSVTIIDTNRKQALTTSAGTRATQFIVAGSTTLQADTGPPMLRLCMWFSLKNSSLDELASRLQCPVQHTQLGPFRSSIRGYQVNGHQTQRTIISEQITHTNTAITTLPIGRYHSILWPSASNIMWSQHKAVSVPKKIGMLVLHSNSDNPMYIAPFASANGAIYIG